MKVLFLTNIPSPYRVDFFKELAGYCELTVLYELPSARDRESSWLKRDDNGSYESVYLKPVFRQSSSAWCPSVRRYLERGNYDIVVVGVYSTPTGMHAIWHLKRKKIPYMISCDGGFVPQWENKLKYKLKKYLLTGACGYLSSGEISDTYLIHYGACREVIYRYPFTSLHQEDIADRPALAGEKAEIKKKLGISEEKVILSVGSFIFRKGFDILLKAAFEMEDKYGVYIVGGTATEEYLRITEEYGLEKVHFLPFMQGSLLKQYYEAADVFAFPTREDIWGLVINEAMAAGLPVVTTDRCAAGMELLDAEWIVPVEDSHALADKVTELLENDTLRGEVSAGNLERIRDYTIENMARVHGEIFQKICR